MPVFATKFLTKLKVRKYYIIWKEVKLALLEADVNYKIVKEFINDNYKLKNNEIAIVHGIGKGILKKEVHKVLKESRIVESYGLDNFNSGCTLVRLVEFIDKNAKK